MAIYTLTMRIETPDEYGLTEGAIRDAVYDAGESLPFSFDIEAITEGGDDAARDRAREVARTMFAGLMPGSTGVNMANEIADKILAAVRSPAAA